ncbi:MAG TPA: FAD-dependent monooxygenase [Pseudonocardia sp.]
MDVVCVGAGPAGLYFATLTKLRDPDASVTVLERNPSGVTFGWGVTFSDDVLDVLYRGDRVSAERIQRDPASWADQVVLVGDKPVAHLGGYGFAIGRHRLLELLAERATELGVTIRYEQPVDDLAAVLAEYPGADLVLAADGVNSVLRDAVPGFGTEVEHGANQYLWLGAGRPFAEFSYGFERTDAGWIWYSAYPFDGQTTTFIPECAPATWRGLGFDQLGPDQTLRQLERIFARHLRGAPLLMQTKPTDTRAPWARFTWVSNRAWHDGRLVLAGDAAHTSHYSIGNGTKLAFDDVFELDRQLAAHPGDTAAALRAYQSERAPAVAARQRIAGNCAGWFERLDDFLGADPDPVRVAYGLRTSGGSAAAPPSGVPWLLHRATQYSAGRWARGQLSSAKRRQRARGTLGGVDAR